MLRSYISRGPSEAQLAARESLPRLQTIPYSHYCELARWALERAGVGHHESTHLPALGFRVADLRGNAHLSETGSFPGDATHTGKDAIRRRRTAVPCLVFPDGRVLRDSRDILDAALPGRLEPALWASLDTELAPAARLVAYHHLLREYGSFSGLVERCGHPVERLVYWALGERLIVPRMRATMGIDEERCEAATRVVRAAFSAYSERLESRPAGSVAAGEQLAKEDLAWASLAGILVVPPTYGGRRWFDEERGHSALMPRAEELPRGLRALCEELRDTAAGRHVLRVYAAHRM